MSAIMDKFSIATAGLKQPLHVLVPGVTDMKISSGL